MSSSLNEPGHLPRLPPRAYQGKSIIHWNFPLQDRRTGWLSDSFHHQFCWVLLHGCARYDVACPLYCLMPDHMHLLIAGWSAQASQRLFISFVRRNLTPTLAVAGAAWQKQPYDHVLRDREAERGSFESIAAYIADNPVRAGLVQARELWPYTGCIIPGYPELQLSLRDYWQRYWRVVAHRNGGSRAQ